MSPQAVKPLNPKQKAFGRELGIAIAAGDRNFENAYVKAGYRRNRGNAARLAADARVRAVADEVAGEAVRLSGLHLAYLQARGIELLHANVFRLTMKAREALAKVGAESAAEQAEIDAALWPLSEFAIDKDGGIKLKVPDKKGVIEMLLKTMPGALAATKHALTDAEGQDLPLAPQLSLQDVARQICYAVFNQPEPEKV